MKSIVVFVLAAFFMVALGACDIGAVDITATVPLSPTDSTYSPIPTPEASAEQYLNIRTEDEIFADFLPATYVASDNGFGFSSPTHITSRNLFRFAVIVDENMCWYDEDERKYYIPVGDIEGILDRYFDGYNFDPSEVYYAVYNAEADILEATALGFGTGGGKLSYVSAEALDGDTVRVELLSKFYDEQTKESSQNSITIVGKISDDGVEYLSCDVY